MPVSSQDARIDEALEPLLASIRWRLSPNGYAKGRIAGKMIYMHHLVLPKRMGLDVDHINRDKLDNRKGNLRYASRSQNNANAKVRIDSISGIKGVCWYRRGGQWRAYTREAGKQIHLGYFDDINDAVAARVARAKLIYKDYCHEPISSDHATYIKAHEWLRQMGLL